jgi:hypothetical protein
MANDSIKIVYTFVDKSSSGINSAIGGLGRLGGAAAKIAVTGLAGATAAMAAAGVAAVKLGSDAEEMQGKFDTVFSNVGGDVQAQLDEFAGAVGRSKFELRGLAAATGDLLKPMGFSEEVAGDMSVSINKLATDLGSFNDMDVGEASQRLNSALLGNHENLQAFGVFIDESILKEELLRMGMADLEGQALLTAKAQARWNLILAGTTDAQGDALRTAGSFANQMRGLKATIFDAGAEIGLSLLPMVTPLVTKFAELAQLAATKLVPVFEDVGSAFTAFFDMQSRGFNITDNMETLFRKLARAVGLNEEFFARVGEVFGGFIQDMQSGEGVLTAIGNAFTEVFADEESVNNFGAAVGEFFIRLGSGHGVVSSITGAIASMFSEEQREQAAEYAKGLQNNFANLQNGATSFVDIAKTKFLELIVTLGRIPALWELIKQTWQGMFEAGQNMVTAYAEEVQPQVDDLAEAFGSLFSAVSELVGMFVAMNEAAGAVPAVATPAGEGVDDMSTAVWGFVDAIKAGLENLTALIGLITTFVENINTALTMLGELKTSAQSMPLIQGMQGAAEEGRRRGSGLLGDPAGAPDAGGAGGNRFGSGLLDKGGNSQSSNVTNNNMTVITNASNADVQGGFNLMNAMAGGI